MASRPVLFVARKLPDAVERRARRDYEARLNADDALYDADRLISGATGADYMLVTATERLSADVIARLPSGLKAVATYSVGYDHIDVPAARARGLTVTNTPDVLTDATADVAMLLLLAAARRAGEGERLVRDGGWRAWAPTFMLGTHVTGKRLGIFGMGRIGRAVARRARGFDMVVHYHNRSRLPDEQENGAIYHATPEALLPHCDFLSLHCPSSAETENFLDERRIALLPPGAIVVNTARGAIVDDAALIAALGRGRIAAAGLDVFRDEPNLDPGYLALPNAVLLPHVGSATLETREAMGFRALDNLDALAAGRPAPDPVS